MRVDPDIGDVGSWSSGRIVHVLEQPVPVTFPVPTPLSDVLNYVRLATATSTYSGIPIYVDPIGLQEAEQSPSSTVSIDLRGIPLKTTLRLCLNQRGLDYIVRQGFLMVTSADDVTPPPEEDIFWLAATQHPEMPARFDLFSEPEVPFLIVGHCLISLLAAGFEAARGPARRRRAPRAFPGAPRPAILPRRPPRIKPAGQPGPSPKKMTDSTRTPGPHRHAPW